MRSVGSLGQPGWRSHLVPSPPPALPESEVMHKESTTSCGQLDSRFPAFRRSFRPQNRGLHRPGVGRLLRAAAENSPMQQDIQ